MCLHFIVLNSVLSHCKYEITINKYAFLQEYSCTILIYCSTLYTSQWAHFAGLMIIEYHFESINIVSILKQHQYKICAHWAMSE